MIYRALIPVKALSEAKSRLAAYLPLQQREHIMLDMLHHVLHVLLDSEMLEQVAVVSPDGRVLERAQEWGALALREEVQGHNPALQAAATTLSPGATALLTISADLPLLQTCDIRRMLTASERHAIVLAPARDGIGTNAILMRPPLAVPYLFGPNSLQIYQDTARQRDLNIALCNSIGLALDIDTIDDLHSLQILRSEWQERTKLATYDL